MNANIGRHCASKQVTYKNNFGSTAANMKHACTKFPVESNSLLFHFSSFRISIVTLTPALAFTLQAP